MKIGDRVTIKDTQAVGTLRGSGSFVGPSGMIIQQYIVELDEGFYQAELGLLVKFIPVHAQTVIRLTSPTQSIKVPNPSFVATPEEDCTRIVPRKTTPSMEVPNYDSLVDACAE